MSGVEACYIRLQRDRVKSTQKTLLNQIITQSRYPAMDRNERRTFEYYADEVAQLRAQAKDLKKAKVVAQRIGVILERTRKELQAIKQHLSDYNFVSTDGTDMREGDGTEAAYNAYENACENGNRDMTMDSSTRHAWIEQAKNMVTCLRNFSLAQRLGNYSLLWNPQDAFVTSPIHGASFDPCANAVSGHLQYREEFLYMQYNTACRTAPVTAQTELDEDGAHNGDIPLDQGTSKKYHNYFSISNPDLAINDLWKQLVCNIVDADGDGSVDDPATPVGTVFLEMIDDERDVACILQLIISKLDDVMHAQQDNDNEQAALACAQEVNQQNTCWFESVCAEMSEIDEEELKEKHKIGESLLVDLTELFRRSSSKKDYFGCVDITSNATTWY